MVERINTIELRWREEFGRRLKDRLEQIGMTQMELAEIIHVSRATINHYISGESGPSVKAVVNIAYALGCKVSDLIDF